MGKSKIKICGITNADDAVKASLYGAWAVGFIFYQKSPRYISPSRARKIIQQLPPFITPVGVFVNQNERAVKDICRFTHIDTVQLHGDESPEYCRRFKDYKIIKAFRVGDDFEFGKIQNYKVDAYLFDSYQKDAYGGTGEPFDWKFLSYNKIDKPYILAGGLNVENVAKALEILTPYAVDVSSGIEKSPGVKDPRQMKAFIDMVNFQK